VDVSHLAELLRLNGNDTAAFEALQEDKGRRLIDVLAGRVAEGGTIEDPPPSIQEISQLHPVAR
jgi:hypothetical protein